MKVNPAGLPRQCLLLACLSAAAGLGGTAATGRCGSIYFDGSLGNAGALNGPNFLIPADRGKQVGGNLFHSFSDFNLIKDDAATFQGPANVQNILARVTGGSASSINGTLRSEISGANLYFINPAGVMFGANAKLDISGSFAVTTADYLKLADGGKLNAQLGGDDTLTAAPISAFGFLNPAPESVTFDATTLTAAPGRGISVIGGDVTLSGANLVGSGSRFEIVSARSSGEARRSTINTRAPLATDSFSKMGDISMRNHSRISASGPEGGAVVIRGGRLVQMERSNIESATSDAGHGEPIDIVLMQSAVNDDSGIGTRTEGSGAGGDLTLSAPSITLTNSPYPSSLVGLGTQSGTMSIGPCGRLTIQCDRLEVTGGFIINADTAGAGRGGDIFVDARESIRLDGLGGFNGIHAESGVLLSGAGSGRGGDIHVKTKSLYLTNGGSITGTALGAGDSGDIEVVASTIVMEVSSPDFTGIASQTNHMATGNGGRIGVRADELTIRNGGEISATSATSGRAGDIEIAVGQLRVENATIDSQANGSGGGGDITIHSRSVTLADAIVSTDSFASGRAGDILFQSSGKLTLLGTASISARSFDTGNGGRIEVGTDALVLSDNARIATSAFSQGNAGEIDIHASRKVEVSGEARISSSTSGIGAGGMIRIAAPRILLLEAASISAGTTGIDPVDFVGPKVNGLRVRLEIEHTFDADLDVSLISPLGSRVPLFFGVGGEGDGFVGTVLSDAALQYIGDGSAPFTGEYQPLGFFSSLDGEPLGGRWKLEISDGGKGDVGRLLGWSLLQGADSFTSKDVPVGIGDLTTIDSKLTIDLPVQVVRGKSGDGGSIVLKADHLLMDGGATIVASTSNSGRGGDVKINAGILTINGHDSDQFAGIYANTAPGADPTLPHGSGGAVTVKTGKFTMTGTANISSSTSSIGFGGDVRITAQSISISGKGVPLLPNADLLQDNAGIFAQSSGLDSGAAGRLTIAAHDITLTEGGEISTSTNGRGVAGAMSITTANLLLDGSGSGRFTGIFAATIPRNMPSGVRLGDGGDIHVDAGNLHIFNGAGIASSTLGSGDAGDISVRATTGEIAGVRSFRLFGPNKPPVTFGGISASAEGEESTGRGGDLDVRIGDLQMSSGGLITARTSGHGSGGSVRVVASRLNLLDSAYISAGTLSAGDGGNVLISSGEINIAGVGTNISARTEPGSTGDGGTVQIEGDDLTINQGGQVSAETLGSGNGGNLALKLTGRVRVEDSGLVTASTLRSGAGGSVGLRAEELILSNGGAITASTAGSGAGGNVMVKAGNILIESGDTGSPSGAGKITGIFAEASEGAVGDGGNLSVFAGDLSISGADALISATSKGPGRSGNVRVEAGEARLANGARVASGNIGSGEAGSVTITAERVLDIESQSLVTTSAVLGNAGEIALSSGDRIEIRNSNVTASAGMDGGSIRITAPHWIEVRDSGISATAGAIVQNFPGGLPGEAGTGGNIFIDPEFLILDHATISANAAIGKGGDIFLRADNFLSSASTITATGTTDGTVEIAAPELDLAAGLFVLPGALLEASTQLREQCARRLGMDFSSFLVIGRGGVSLGPDEALPDLRAAKKRRAIR